MVYFTHIAMALRNLDTSTAFYQDFWCLEIVHAQGDAQDRVVWMTQPGKANDFIFVFMTGDVCPPQEPRDFSHFGFALESRDAVDALAERGRLSQNLIWPPRDESYPVLVPMELASSSVMDSPSDQMQLSLGMGMKSSTRTLMSPQAPRVKKSVIRHQTTFLVR